MAKVKVTLAKSLIGSNDTQKATAKTLGLGKVNSSAVHDTTPQILGMINKLQHLVKVEEVE